MKWINSLIETLIMMKHVGAASLKIQSGRLFVFRDTPTWVLKKLIDLNHEEASELLTQAREEWKLRETRFIEEMK